MLWCILLISTLRQQRHADLSGWQVNQLAKPTNSRKQKNRSSEIKVDNSWGKVPQIVLWHKHTCVCTHVCAYVFPQTGLGRKRKGRAERQGHPHLSSAANLWNSLASQWEPRRSVSIILVLAFAQLFPMCVLVTSNLRTEASPPQPFLCLFSEWSTWQSLIIPAPHCSASMSLPPVVY